jgi:hypothetical protein
MLMMTNQLIGIYFGFMLAFMHIRSDDYLSHVNTNKMHEKNAAPIIATDERLYCEQLRSVSRKKSMNLQEKVPKVDKSIREVVTADVPRRRSLRKSAVVVDTTGPEILLPVKSSKVKTHKRRHS